MTATTFTATIKFRGEAREITFTTDGQMARETTPSVLAATRTGSVEHPAQLILVARKFGPITASDGSRWALGTTVAMNRPATFVGWNS